MTLKRWFRKVSVSLLIILLIGTSLPLLPTPYGTQKAYAAPITSPESSVDGSTQLSVTPNLDGQSIWYYDGLTEVIDEGTNSLIGQAYRYRSNSGLTRTMINPGSIGEWAEALGGNKNYVLQQMTFNSNNQYTFQPSSSTPAFSRYLIAEVFHHSGVSYTDLGNVIEVKKSSQPKVSKFSIKEAPDIESCYLLNSSITIDINLMEFLPNHNTFKKIEVFSHYPESGSTNLIKDYSNVATSNGEFKSAFSYTLRNEEPVKFFIRAYDGIDRVDQDTSSLNRTVGAVSPVGLEINACAVYKPIADDNAIPMYDFTPKTLLEATSLDGRGVLGRVNDKMRSYPSASHFWAGPLRYPTLYKGHPDDGGKVIPHLTNSFNVESSLGKNDTIKAYRFPFMYVAGPIKQSIAGPNKMVHDSLETATFNVQDINHFDISNVSTMFNGNGSYVLNFAPKHAIRIFDGDKLGTYYWIRDLAEFSGGAAGNLNRGGNGTNLEIFQTDYPDIDVFELKENMNTFAVGEKLYFNFNGYEYVSDTRLGLKRNIVDWNIAIVDGPEKGVIKGKLSSDKSVNNSKKPEMKQYDGKYQSGTPYFTPLIPGTYTMELKITDQVQRTTTSKRITVKIGEDGGLEETPPDTEHEKINNPPIAFVSADKFHYWPEIMNIFPSSLDPDGDELSEVLKVDGVVTGTQWTSSRVTSKTVRHVHYSVDDGNGGTAQASTTFETLPTKPTAETTVEGRLKQNRAVIVDANFSDKRSPVHVAPIDYSKTKWTVTPITDGVTQSDVKERIGNDHSKKQLLFKQPGKYEVQVTVTNVFGEESDVHTRILDIVPDEEPIARFTVDKQIYFRDVEDNQQATIILVDDSVSLDDDTIQQRIWYVEFDANNDGVFGTAADGGKQVISSKNEKSVVYKTNHVGHYRFSLEVKEAFGDHTYEEFIQEEDYLRDKSDVLDSSGSVAVYMQEENFNIATSDTAIKVDNVAPVIDFGVRRKNKIEVVLDFGGMDQATQQHLTGSRSGGGVNNGGGGGRYDHYYYTVDTKDKNKLTAYAGSVEAELLQKGIDAKVTVENCYLQRGDTDGTCVRDIPVWGNVDYGSYSYSSYSGTTPYSGSWEVTSSSSEPIMSRVPVWCSNGFSSHAPPCLFEENTTYGDVQVGTRYSASLRRYVSDWRWVVTHYTSSGCSSTEQIDTTDFTSDIANKSYSANSDYKYYFRMDKNPWSWRSNNTKRNQVINKIKNENLFFWSNADNTLRTDAQSLLNSAGKEGQYTRYNMDYLQANIQKVKDTLINKYMIEQDSETFTIVLGDEVDYTTVYSDHENDPEYQREWRFVHDYQNVNGRTIDNQPSGPIAQSGLYINAPMQLSEVGTYTVTLRSKDNPLSEIENDFRFEEYRRWSDEEIVREYKINVHRRPIADFKAIVEEGTLALELDPTDSYDPDHEINGTDKGIVEYVWEKYVVDDVEHIGAPPSLLEPFKDYFITLRVKDIDGAYGTVTKMVTTKNVNLRPVALFDSPSVVLRNQPLNIKDRSYDPNNDPLTNYNITIKNASNGVVVWTGQTFPQSFESVGLGTGKYLVGLTVWDIPRYPPPLQSFLFEREITVLENQPPNSCFELSRTTINQSSIPCVDGMTSPHTIYDDAPAVYTDKSSDPEGHELINYSWTVEKLDEANNVTESWNTGSPPINFIQFGGVGKYRITQVVFDNPPSPLPSLGGSYTRIFNVERGPQAPYAMFEYNPLLPIEGDTIDLIDQSWDEDGEVVQWHWSIIAPNGTTTTQVTPNPKITNAQKGTYRVSLHVWDDTTPTRLRSKVPAVKEIIVAEKVLINPVALFFWEPQKPFLGETITLNPDSSYDLDGTIASYQWSIRTKEGVVVTSTEQYPTIVASSEYYDVTLTVRDNDNLSSPPLTQRVHVNIAKLTPLVTHNDKWKQYWESEGEDPDTNKFLAGEQFVIRLKTTPANRVEGVVDFGGSVGNVLIPSSEFKLVEKDTFEYVWETVLWRNDFDLIDNGGYLFKFTGYHPVNTPEVESIGNYIIEIVGDVYSVLDYHQRF